KKSVFKHLAYNPLYPNVLRRPIVWSVIADDDDIWFTDISMGLNRYRRSSGKVEKYLDQMDFPENMKQVKEIYFTSFVPDGDSGFWIGTSGRGIIHFWPETGKMERFFSRNVKLKADFTTCLLLDKSYLWIGSYFGLERMNLTDGTIDFFQTAEVIQSMKFDRQGYIWLSCRAGLYYFDTTQFRVSDRYSEINALLPDKNVTATQFDKNGVLWIGTQAGLSAYDLNSSKFTTYTEANGLPDNMIYTILLDDKNDLWLSTNHGISHFIQNEQRFVNYDKSDGLPANEFNSNAAFIDTDNTLYFGSINGLLSFNPSGLMEKNPPPAVEITALNVFDKSINFRQTNPELDYTQNYLTFQFAALDFVNPERNSFRYRLDGFETEWTLSSRPFAIYPKLPAGDYTFRVKAANSGGVWNEDGASLQFVILHPWWEQNWFYLTVLIVIILTLWMIHRQRLQSAKKREIELERIIQERTIEIDRQARELKLLDRMKSKFFTNISHEFRTPLTLIIGPLEELQEKTTDNRMQSTYQRMIFNAKRLLRLINELLELSRLELGKNQLNTEQVDLVEHTNYIINSFLSFTEYKQIDFSFVADTQSYRCEIDIEKYEMILSNLLGNAIKYTDSHGKIKTEFKHDKNGISIQVIDNGIGINAADLPHIFDRFYQSDNIDSSIEGSGIGLSVVRELLQLMGGDIKVESQPGNGACFTINLPLKKLGKPATIAIEAYDSPVDHAHDNGKPLLLIAEDHPQLLDYISEQFKHSYSLLRCSNGREALLQAREMIPDLIISDLMMPEMDGMQLAKEIRLDSKTNHIPFIMLTAKAEESEKLKSLAIGIDDFIIKPFKQSELLARVQNLLEQRQRLKNRYQDQFILDTDNLNMESIDQQFIRSVLTQCESALADSAFTVERLADQLSMSRKQLHRKLTAILNISPNRLIRILRLKKARLMIENKHAAVSEIAYAVGFESLSYFSKCYKDEFGYLPSEFQS
ncbi:MAG: response regulator, partial [Calditrichaeota bacterium]|nr:response regulator [Calditrichota bacterium]